MEKEYHKGQELTMAKLGFNCPVLECAFTSKVGYCFKDCEKFPCDVLYRGFPYSKGFLDIFKRA